MPCSCSLVWGHDKKLSSNLGSAPKYFHLDVVQQQRERGKKLLQLYFISPGPQKGGKMEVNICNLLYLPVEHVSRDCKHSPKKQVAASRALLFSTLSRGQQEKCLFFDIVLSLFFLLVCSFILFLLPLITGVSAKHLPLLKTCPRFGVKLGSSGLL